MMPEGFGYRQEPSDIHWFLAIGTILFSVLLHVAALYYCADLKVDRRVYHGRDYAASERVPPMRIGVMPADPMAINEAFAQEERKIVASPSASISDQVKALNQPGQGALAAPQPVPVDLPTASSITVPEHLRAVDRTPWLPRQEIIEIFDRHVQDEIATLPRLEIPDVVRVPKAPDIVPSVDPTGREIGKNLEPARSAPAAMAVSSAKDLAGAAETIAAPPPSMNPESPLSQLGADLIKKLETTAAKAEEAAEKEKPHSDAAKIPIPEPDRPALEKLSLAEQKALAAQDKIEKLRETVAYQPLDRELASSVEAYHDTTTHRLYFRIAIAPRSDQPVPVIPKDIAWVQDVSGSIGADRLSACRKALAQEVTALNPGDRFTVISFRNTLERCFPNGWAEPSVVNIAKAQQFIDEMRCHGSTDVFGSLRALLTLPRDPKRPLIVFIATDGKPTTGVTESATIISEFSNLNNGMMSVYMFGTTSSANMHLLNMLAYCNRGASEAVSFFSLNLASTMGTMMAGLRNPVMSDVSVVFDSASKIEAYPRRTTNLYRDLPLVIGGTCPDTTRAFTCQIRGLAGTKGYDSILRFTFGDHFSGSSKLRDLWAVQKMYHLASRYALNPTANRNLLTEMGRLSNEFDIPAIYSISGN